MKRTACVTPVAATLAVAALVMGGARADISAPDGIVYGTILLTNGTAVSAVDTQYAVQARRLADGKVVASYRMGSRAEAGNFYVIEIPVEEMAPTSAGNASLLNTSLTLALLRETNQLAELTYVLTERGQVERRDFGVPVDDADANGLSDIYELIVFGNVARNPDADSDGDGFSDGAEFVAGTNPKGGQGSGVAVEDDTFVLCVDNASGNPQVSFLARPTSGLGYDGKTRHYRLQRATNCLPPWEWEGVDGYTNVVVGTTQSVLYPVLERKPARLYRGRVWLTTP